MESRGGGVSAEYGLLLPFFLALILSLCCFRKKQPNVGACGAKGLSVVNSQRRLNLLISIIQDLPENMINLFEKEKWAFLIPLEACKQTRKFKAKLLRHY